MYYSQFGQDRFLEENFFSKLDPKACFFIDIGAYDGVACSNTKFFEDKGWQGVCVEPIPDIFSLLKSNRKCVCLNCAVAGKHGHQEFVNIKYGPRMLSGLNKNLNQKDWDRINREISTRDDYEVIQVDCAGFNELTGRNYIDYLSLDTEGSELEILKGINWNYYLIDFISVENNHLDGHLISFLQNKNYRLIKVFGHVDFLFERIGREAPIC